MTANDMTTLRALMEKGSDSHPLCEMNSFSAQRLRELGAQALTGTGHGERLPERVNHRSGYRDRLSGS